MYKYFEELENRKECISTLGVPVDYYCCKSFYDERDDIITLSDGTDGLIYNWPDSWYITPDGYLYNTGSGHKQGNLLYPYYKIKSTFQQDKKIMPICHNKEINDTLKRGYITYTQFRNFSNLRYTFPSVIISENVNNDDVLMNLYGTTCEQESLITLIVGHLAAETVFYNSFSILNNSNHKKEIISQINKMDMPDIFVKFAKFNKVETNLERTITTSSLNGIKEFSEYLKRGWDLQIIPGIVYDQVLDKLIEVDFDLPIVNKYLDNELNNYSGKGRVLIRHKTF